MFTFAAKTLFRNFFPKKMNVEITSFLLYASATIRSHSSRKAFAYFSMLLPIPLRIFGRLQVFGPRRSFTSVVLRHGGSCSSPSIASPQNRFQTSISYISFRTVTSASKTHGGHEFHAGPKSANVSKRGPKFRTPSKMKDASHAFGVRGVFEDDRLSRRPDWNIWAYATAEEYRMEPMGQKLRQESVYEVNMVANDLPDVFRLIPRSKTDEETGPREIFVFR